MLKFLIIPRSEAGSGLKVEHDRDRLNKMDFRRNLLYLDHIICIINHFIVGCGVNKNHAKIKIKKTDINSLGKTL